MRANISWKLLSVYLLSRANTFNAPTCSAEPMLNFIRAHPFPKVFTWNLFVGQSEILHNYPRLPLFLVLPAGHSIPPKSSAKMPFFTDTKRSRNDYYSTIIHIIWHVSLCLFFFASQAWINHSSTNPTLELNETINQACSSFHIILVRGVEFSNKSSSSPFLRQYLVWTSACWSSVFALKMWTRPPASVLRTPCDVRRYFAPYCSCLSFPPYLPPTESSNADCSVALWNS